MGPGSSDLEYAPSEDEKQKSVGSLLANSFKVKKGREEAGVEFGGS